MSTERSTSEELAHVAGLTESDVMRFIGSGVLSPGPGGRFAPPDVAKARLVAALVDAGLELDHLAGAVEQGRLSLDFVEHLVPEPSRCVRIESPADEFAVSKYEGFVQPILGTERQSRDWIRDEDLALLRIIASAVEICGLVEPVIRTVRAATVSARHVVEIQRDFVDEMLLEPAIARTGSPLTALADTAEERIQLRELGRSLVSLLMDRFLDDAVFDSLVRFSELALASGGVASPRDGQAIVFVDVTGYTKLSEQAGDQAAADQAMLLADYTHELAGSRNGRLVRSLGDGAVVHFPDATGAVGFALEAVANAEERGLWTLHAGANTGPMLRREGNYFGTTVNVAARVADHAGPRQVLVTRSVVALGRVATWSTSFPSASPASRTSPIKLSFSRPPDLTSPRHRGLARILKGDRGMAVKWAATRQMRSV